MSTQTLKIFGAALLLIGVGLLILGGVKYKQDRDQEAMRDALKKAFQGRGRVITAESTSAPVTRITLISGGVVTGVGLMSLVLGLGKGKPK